jgi:PhzF family phenazine biosynthesis protein
LHGPLPAEQLAAALAALGVERTELDPECPNVVAGAGRSRALIALRTGAILARLRPDLTGLAALSASGGPAGFFVYSLAPAIAGCDSEARMFCPALGIAEDPVSGNAHAMLASQLRALGRIPSRAGALEWVGRQGHHLGRPGVVTVRVLNDAAGGALVQVGGSARLVFDSTLEL